MAESHTAPVAHPRSFRDLTVWQESAALARVAMPMADRFPAGYAFLGDQLRRASTSVSLNIAEGNGKHALREYVPFLRIARGSLNEVEAIVSLLVGTTLAPSADIAILEAHVRRTGQLLSALTNALERRLASQKS